MKKINLRIAELRHKKKITQQELADIVGVSFQTNLSAGKCICANLTKRYLSIP